MNETITNYALEILGMSDEELAELVANSPNKRKLIYTILHRKAIFDVCCDIGYPFVSISGHDCDKMVALLFLSDKEVKTLHLQRPHHQRTTTDRKTLIEMIIDWESARFSKPDKPLNAYGTLYKHYPDMEDRILPLLQEYGLDEEVPSKGTPMTEENFAKLVSEFSNEDIVEAVKEAALEVLGEE